jgi:hypothetical protein
MGILDVLPPTRLSLDTDAAASLETATHGNEGETNAWDMEPLILEALVILYLKGGTQEIMVASMACISKFGSGKTRYK